MPPRAGRQLRIVAEDPTRVFLSRRGPGWYGRQGIAIEVLRAIELRAITVNPVAPQSHSFDSARQLCPRAAVLHHGRLAFDGPVEQAWERYRQLQLGPAPGPHIQTG